MSYTSYFSKKIYKTGDLCRWLPDGSIEFLGRIDHMVKIRGFRIELSEIEHWLGKHPDIKEAVVTANKSGETGDQKELFAFVTGDFDLNPDVTALFREYLGKFLPNYMIPHYFVKLAKLPLTPSDKINRKVLDRLAADATGKQLAFSDNYAAPRNETEEKLVNIWQDVLNREQIGIKDNFFDSGGHSLKAARMISRIHKEISVEIGLRDIFAAQTIAGLAEIVAQKERTELIDIKPTAELEYYDLSNAQRRLWVLHQFEDAGSSYNIPAAFTLHGRLDIAALNKAFQALIARHEILRTCFKTIQGEPKQIIYRKIDFSIEIETGDPSLITRHAETVFDLSKAPLLNVKLLKLDNEAGEAKHILLFNIHHIISDGWSVEILIGELSALYDAYTGSNVETYLPPLRIQYKDYAYWQHSYLSSALAKKQKEYWHKKLSHEGKIPRWDFPGDFPRPAVKSYEGDSLYFEFDKELAAGINRLCKDRGVTLFMVLLAVVNLLIYRYTGREDIIIGSPLSGRNHPDLEDQIGFYVNTLPLRSRLAGDESFASFLGQVKQTVTGAYENQVYPFDRLVDELLEERDLSRSPFFDIVVDLYNPSSSSQSGSQQAKISPFPIETGVSKFDLTFNFAAGSDGISLSLEYCTALFRRSTVQRLYHWLENVIRSVVENPALELADIRLVSEEEEHILIERSRVMDAGDDITADFDL